jgi:hypothetical protein
MSEFDFGFSISVFYLVNVDFFALVVQLPERCGYYRWQKAYFLELIEADLIQLC